MDFSVPSELVDLQELVRRYVEHELAPLEDVVDQADDIDPDVMQRLRDKAVEIGIYGFNLPEEIGGGGVGPVGEVLIGQEIGHTSIAMGEAIGRLPQALARADGDQRKWLVEPALRAEVGACIALTEPDAGSDLGGVQTRATEQGGCWHITGSKQFISQAETSDYILVLAVTNPGVPLRDRFTVFIVDRDDPGVHFLNRYRKLGWNGYHISAFALDDVTVGPERVLGGVNEGFATMMSSVNGTRLFIAARCVGAADELMKLSVRFANERKTFGKPLSEHQGVSFKIADMDVELEAARMLTFYAAWRQSIGAPDARIATSRAKLYATEMAGRAADTALQIHGGAGFMKDYPIERMFRDLRGYRIGEGSSEIQRIQIARNALSGRAGVRTSEWRQA
jgi:acyl-CoA dehydrogenase